MKSFIQTFTVLYIFLLTFISCEYSDVKPPTGGVVTISVIDRDRNDLINPENSYSFSEDSIRMYYRYKNTFKMYVNNRRDRIFGYYIEKDIYKEFYSITFSIDISDKQTTTLIKWGENNVDTLVCDIKKYNTVSKVVFNGEMKWQESDGTTDYPFFIITK